MTHSNNIIKIKREVLVEVIASIFSTGVRLSWLKNVDKKN